MRTWRDAIGELTTVQWIALAMMGVVATASVYGWHLVARRMRRGREPLPYEPRTPINWTGVETLTVIAFYLASGYWSGSLARGLYLRDVSQAAAPSAGVATGTAGLTAALVKSIPELPRLLQGKVAGDVLFLIVAWSLFRFVRKTPGDQIGLAMRPAYDLRVGSASFVLIVPPVILLMAVLVQFLGKSVHPVLLGLQASRDVRLWLWSVAAVVGTAPLVEEFLFRGVIQNWLNRAWSFAADSHRNAEGKLIPPAPWAAALAHDGPVVATAGFFALVHLGHGPDPIPLFFFALGLGYLFRQTNRIWAGWVVHLLLNVFSLAVLPLGL